MLLDQVLEMLFLHHVAVAEITELLPHLVGGLVTDGLHGFYTILFLVSAPTAAVIAKALPTAA